MGELINFPPPDEQNKEITLDQFLYALEQFEYHFTAVEHFYAMFEAPHDMMEDKTKDWIAFMLNHHKQAALYYDDFAVKSFIKLDLVTENKDDDEHQ